VAAVNPVEMVAMRVRGLESSRSGYVVVVVVVVVVDDDD